MRIRTFLAAAALGLAVLGTAAGAASAQDTAAEKPREGGTLSVAIEADLREPDALQLRVGVDKIIMGSTAYDPLFQTDQQGNSLPALATGATASADAKVWTFRIREGVEFHNGKPFTAADVKSVIAAFLDPANASNLAGDLANIDSVAVTGDYEVQITLKSPDSRLPSLFTDNIFMFDAEHFESGVPIGTGPYRFVERVPGDRIVFERFDDHWRGRPPLDRVVFRVIPDPQVAALELQAGGIDVIPTNISPDLITMLRANPDINVYDTDGNSWYGIFFNFEKARRGDYGDEARYRAFREGIAYLWEPDKLVPPIIGEFGVAAYQPTPPWQLGSDPAIGPFPHDPERGKALLAEAGFPEGAAIEILVWMRPHNCDVATAFASYLTELGYAPSVTCLPPEAALTEVKKYQYDLLFSRVSGRANAAQNYRDRYRSSLFDERDQWTYQSPEVDALIERMMAATDPAEYEATGKEIANIVVKRDIATLSAYFDKVVVAARTEVKGIEVSPIVYYGFLMNAMTTVWLDR